VKSPAVTCARSIESGVSRSRSSKREIRVQGPRTATRSRSTGVDISTRSVGSLYTIGTSTTASVGRSPRTNTNSATASRSEIALSAAFSRKIARKVRRSTVPGLTIARPLWRADVAAAVAGLLEAHRERDHDASHQERRTDHDGRDGLAAAVGVHADFLDLAQLQVHRLAVVDAANQAAAAHIDPFESPAHAVAAYPVQVNLALAIERDRPARGVWHLDRSRRIPVESRELAGPNAMRVVTSWRQEHPDQARCEG